MRELCVLGGLFWCVFAAASRGTDNGRAQSLGTAAGCGVTSNQAASQLRGAAGAGTHRPVAPAKAPMGLLLT